MNTVHLIGRLTRDPQVRDTQSGMMAAFTLAVDRPTKDKQTDFPRVVVFGKQAESCERFLRKGSMVGISGSLHTGSYDKGGEKRYTTDVIANRVEFLTRSENAQETRKNAEDDYYEDFEEIQEEMPF